MSMTANRVKTQAALNGEKRKLTIKPLKFKPKLPDNFEAATWAKLQQAVQAVQEKRAVSCSLEELYRAVEDICLHKMAERLYQNLQKECDRHIAAKLRDLAAGQTIDPLIFLEQVNHCWQDHTSQMLTVRSIFLYLDRTFVVSNAEIRSLFDMALQSFRIHLSDHPEIERKTTQGLLMLIQHERDGNAVDRALLGHLLRMYTALGIYGDAFQGPFLTATEAYYAREGEHFMQTTDAAEYLQHCERRLGKEFDRCQIYLDASSRKPLIALVEQQLLEQHMTALLQKGFDVLMSEQRLDDLRRLYALCMRIQRLDELRGSFRDYVHKSGTGVVLDEDKDKEMVVALLELKAQMDAVLAQSFQGNQAFGHALKESFEKFINQRQNKPAELIAKFVDAELRTGNKGQTEDDVEARLDQALTLFRYISGKDVFEAFYKKDLAKRLLLGKSASTDAEKNMISKLKAECGSQFTNKLEGMFKDMDLSRDVMTSFRQSTSAQQRLGQAIDMNVSILTSGFWPSYPISDAKLPNELTKHQQVFKDFYLSKHSGRRLVWQNSLGTCMLRAAFPKGTKELSVSLFQTVVLMLFNDVDSLTLSDIQEMAGIQDKELRRTLQSLACGKIRVLIKEPKGKEVEDGDSFRYHDGFAAQLFRIKINSIQLKETQEENKKTNDQVLQDRQYQIDAAIVRTMKTRKTLSHRLLVSELLTQLKFPIQASDLKKRIESLIDREYLERDERDPSIYNYLA